MQWLGLSTLEFTFALLGFGGAVVAFYLLDPRPRRVEVPALALFQGLLQSPKSAALSKRLRRLLSLLLALLWVVLLLLSLADPVRPLAVGERSVVVLLDATASMAAADVPGAPARTTRLEAAKREAQEALQQLGPRDRAIVVALEQRASVRGSWTSRRADLLDAIAAVRQTDTAGDLLSATRFALDLLHGRVQPELWIFTDGNLRNRDTATVALRAAPELRVQTFPVGSARRNLAITAFSVRSYPLDLSHQECMLQVSSFSDEAEEVVTTVQAGDALLYQETLQLAPGETVTRTLVDLPSTRQVLEARIAPSSGADVLARDDRAFVALSQRVRTRVLLVSEGNRYLEAALLLDEYLEVEEIRPEQYKGAQGFDVVVFDRVRPPADPEIAALHLGPGAGTDYFPLALGDSVARPYFDRVADHPAARRLALKDVNVARATRVRLEPNDRVIAGTRDGVPLWVEGHRSAPFMALTFDVRESDLPLRTAWPLLLLRSLEQLHGRQAETPRPHSAGELVELPLPEAQDASLHAPDGTVTRLPNRDGKVRFVPARAGVYELRHQDARLAFAVHFPATESDLAPRPLFTEVAPTAAKSSFEGTWLDERVWPLLVGLAFLLLLLEWLTFHRRWTV